MSFFQKNKQFFCVFPQNFLLHLSHCSLNDEKTPPNKYYKQTKQFWWKKRNINFIKIKKVEVRVPKITPACYFYARLKILLQNSLHVSLMRPRKKNYKNYFSVSMSCTLLQKKLPKTAGKSTESLYNIHTVFYYSRKKPNYGADNFICN